MATASHQRLVCQRVEDINAILLDISCVGIAAALDLVRFVEVGVATCKHKSSEPPLLVLPVHGLMD